MRKLLVITAVIVITGMQTNCYAACNCDDWMEKGGYCVDYIKIKIPTFPIPMNISEIEALKNRDIAEVKEGDVAIFTISNYWHVAFVEKVKLNHEGAATSIDVSEMNFGDQMSFDEFKSQWKLKSKSEWKRALCCGVTDKYDQTSSRKNVALDTVKQIWSPEVPHSVSVNSDDDDTVIEKVREVFNKFFHFTGREL